MDKYTEPEQLDFDNAVSAVSDIIRKTAGSATTKAGSVIHELLVRPAAYLFAWMSGNLEEAVKSCSISTLKESQATVNETADLMAANYFVTRLQGTKASGVITITMNKAVAHIAGGARFNVGGTLVETTSQVVATSTKMSSEYSDVLYVEAIAMNDGTYISNIPVTAIEVGALEIPAGTDVEVMFPNNFIIAAELASAITGGGGVETDAELFKRAEYNTAASGVGTYFGIKKKLSTCPVSVEDLSVVAGEDEAIFRSRFNTLNINPGGFVDVYVKTQKQSSTKTITATASLEDGGTEYGAIIEDTSVAGLHRVVSVVADGERLSTFYVTYGSSQNTYQDRLSGRQSVKVSFTLSAVSADTVTAFITVEYLPGISAIQEYMDREENTFIGQSTLIKSAIPVTVALSCSAHKDGGISDEEKAILKDTAATYINSVPVGTRALNFSDVVKACKNVVPDVELRVPCILSASVVLKDGSISTYYSDTGVLDISDTGNTAYWEHQMCFFSTTTDRLRIGAE